MDYNKVWFSRSTFHEKAKKKFTGCLEGYKSDIPVQRAE